MKKNNKNYGFTRLVDFGDAILSRTKSASPKLTTGFMVVEVLVAVSIIAASILVVAAVAQKSIYVSRESFHIGQATFILEEGAEAVRVIRDNTWSNISGLTVGTVYYPTWNGSTWTLSPTQNTLGIFERTVVFANVYRDNTTKDIVSSGGTLDAGTKLVTVAVSWFEGSTTVSKTLQFYITNIFAN